MPRFALAAAVARMCVHEEPQPPPRAVEVAVVAVVPVDAAIDARPIDAPIDAPPIDAAPIAMPAHRHLHVRDFSDEAYFGQGAIESPGLPAYDAATATIAVAYDDQVGLGTLPNVDVQLLDPDAAIRAHVPVWTQAQSRAFVGNADPTPAKLRALERSIDREIARVEPQLAAYAPMTACTADETAETVYLPYCPGHAAWHCDDATITYHRDGDGNPRPTLAITARGKTVTVDTRAWRRAPIQIYSGKDPIEKVATTNCIGAAHLVPNSRDVLLELEHTCNISGDWCSADGPSWHVVHLPE